jgi:DNA processing protein
MRKPARAAAVIALLRSGALSPRAIAEALETDTDGAYRLLEQAFGLLAGSEVEPILAEIEAWATAGIAALTPPDPGYPRNLQAVHDRPPLLFAGGRLMTQDERSVAVIGTRTPSGAGRRTAGEVAVCLADHGFTVVSGLAAGIDTAAHTAALELRGRTIAVLGTGLRRCYPPQNRALQERIASEGAVLSRCWPDDGPSRERFHARNALMSGISLASVIVEAGPRSGCRVQARAALAHGRPVLVYEGLLRQEWVVELAARPGVHVFSRAREVPSLVAELAEGDLPLSA